jgi:DNA polymerase III epsilon subunit-like protein
MALYQISNVLYNYSPPYTKQIVFAIQLGMIVVDVETTGLSPYRNGIISIGAVNFENPLEYFYEECALRDGASVSKGALKINGFKAEDIYDTSKQSAGYVMRKFIDWLNKFEDKSIAGHNVNFDLGFLRSEAKYANLTYDFGFYCIDLPTVAYFKYKQAFGFPMLKDGKTGLKFDVIMKFCGLTHRRGIHNALEDAMLTAECFSRMIYGKSLLQQFQQDELPAYLVQ